MGFEMSLIVVEAIRGRCASFTIITATVSEIFGGQTNSSISVVYDIGRESNKCVYTYRQGPFEFPYNNDGCVV